MARLPHPRGPFDLAAVAILTALLVLCIVPVTSNVGRIMLGLPFMLLFPGYALLAALFPRKGSLSSLQRLALTIALSLAVVPLLGLLLNYLWHISLYPVLTTISAFIAVMCVIAYFRRAAVPVQERFEPHFKLPTLHWGHQSTPDRVLTILLVAAVIGAVSTAIYVTARPRSEEHFTEFYLLGSAGAAQYYSREVVLGANFDVTVGLTNHEGQEVTYRIRIMADGTELHATDGLALHNGDSWQEAIALTPTRAADNQKVEFLLYRDGEPEPCQRLHLWIDVRDPSSPPSTP